MVQRKVSNKLGIEASSTSLKAKKNPSTNMKPSIQNYESVPRGAELSKKMKKSRSFKRSLDFDGIKKPSLRRFSLPDQLQKQRPCSPLKQSPTRVSGAISCPPNYMKSTSSSEARKEQKQASIKTPSKSMIESSSKKLLSPACSSSSVGSHKLSSRSLNRSSSLKKVRTLTKAPSFKPSRSAISANKCSKAALCGNLDVKRATCSSTLKESKFPSFLDLNPGGTESKGTSVMKVCPYNYCSLNGHRHNTVPPLKSFLSAKRRIMKAQRTMKPVSVSPCKAKPCKDDGEGKEDVLVVKEADKPALLSFNGEEPGCFIEIHVKESKEKAESIFVELARSEVGFLNFGKTSSKEAGVGGEDGALHESAYDGGNFDWESSTSIILDELFAESSDMEWEEGRLHLTGMEIEDGISTPSDQTYVHSSGNEILCLLHEEGSKKDDVDVAFFKEFLVEESVELSQDVIPDCHEQFSDSESSLSDEYDVTEIDQFLQHYDFPGDCEDVLFPFAVNKDEMVKSSVFSKEITDGSATEDEIIKDSPISDGQTVSTTESTEERLIDEQEREFFGNDFDKTSEETVEQPLGVRDFETPSAGQELPVSDQADEDAPLIVMENSGLAKQASPVSEEGDNSNSKKLFPFQNSTQAVEATEAEVPNRTVSEEEKLQAENKSSENVGKRRIFNKESSFIQDHSNTCNSLNITRGRRKPGEHSEELKSFNPREPNYLEVELDPEAEKVDLRHQDMDERRNSEEWMLDYALRKAVNQLAPARKRKVALLVEAFETVIPPVHNCETRKRPISSGFARIQACN